MQRLIWIDAARGLAIIAVLLMHYQVWVINDHDVNPGVVTLWWTELSSTLAPFRMPLLMLISGIVASKTFLTGSRSAGLRRAASSFYLVAVWAVLFFLLSRPIDHYVPGRADNLAEMWRQILIPSTIMWFVYALGASALVLVALRRAPHALTMAVFLVIPAALAQADVTMPEMARRAIIYAAFFAAGVLAASTIVRFVREATPRTMPVLWLMYLGMTVVTAWVAPVPFLRYLAWFATDLCAALLTLLVVAWLCRWPLVARPLSFIGRRTLPIFILHLPVSWLVLTIEPLNRLLLADGTRWLWPVFGVAFLMSVALAVYAVCRRTPLRWLFTVPWPVRAPRGADRVRGASSPAR